MLNSGGTPNVTAFVAGRDGALHASAARDLPGALGAAQVSVAPDGDALVVSERLSNRLETLALDRFGRPGAPVITASSGAVPFGFAFGRRGDDRRLRGRRQHGVLVPARRTAASARSPPRSPVGQGAACWVAVSPDGRFAYTGNASGSISGFAVARDGVADRAQRRRPDRRVCPRRATWTSRATAASCTPSARAAHRGGRVTGYRVAANGALTQITSVPALAGITGAAGA